MSTNIAIDPRVAVSQAPSGSEFRTMRVGDTAIVLAQGPPGLAAIAEAKRAGSARVIAVASDISRAVDMKAIGADIVLDSTAVDVAAELKRLTGIDGSR